MISYCFHKTIRFWIVKVEREEVWCLYRERILREAKGFWFLVVTVILKKLHLSWMESVVTCSSFYEWTFLFAGGWTFNLQVMGNYENSNSNVKGIMRIPSFESSSKEKRMEKFFKRNLEKGQKKIFKRDLLSVAGTWTRVFRVRAEYPDQLDYNGFVEDMSNSFHIWV